MKKTAAITRLCAQKTINAVREEIIRSVLQHGYFNSAHEAYGVLAEEVDEFWEHVKRKRERRSKKEMRKELIQVAAMAIKAVISLTE